MRINSRGDEIKVGGTRGLSEGFPITLVRLPDARGVKLWFISRQTLDRVPEVYDSLRFPRLEKDLPAYLVRNRPLGMPVWQWIAIILLAPIAMALGWALALLIRTIWQLARRVRGLSPLPPQPIRRFGPGAMLLAVIIHYWFCLRDRDFAALPPILSDASSWCCWRLQCTGRSCR